MISHLEKMIERFNHVEELMADPEVIRDQKRFQSLAKERSELETVLEKYKEYSKAKEELEEAQSILSGDSEDGELLAMAKTEAQELQNRLEKLEGEIKLLLIPKDPLDSKNILMEIRAGAGGDEAGLFAGDLLRMYQRYAEIKNWKTELVSAHDNDLGGFKEVILEIAGGEIYSKLKFESGVHRVQRIPVTESGGRIHTSTVTVAVLPEAEEVDVAIDPNDLRIDVFRSSGCGGQSVNTTDSAVRITHVPTNLVVSCQDEKSQHKNKAKALKILRARLLEEERRRAHDARAAKRKNQVGTGDRSERIRTYNFPQGRVTDHRIGLTLYKLPQIMEGDLDEVFDTLAMADQEAQLKNLEEEVEQGSRGDSSPNE